MERFKDKYEVSEVTTWNGSSCWIWTGGKDLKGYGAFWNKDIGKVVKAHRWSYEHRIGPIPEGLTLDHLCRNRACVNPSHLEPVTSAVNSLRGVSPPAENARKTHCPRGHPYEGDNLYIDPKGQRECMICRRAGFNAWKEKNAESHKIYMREYFRKYRAARKAAKETPAQ